MSEEIKNDVLEIDEDQLQELIGNIDKLPPIEIPFEWFDSEKFHEGIKDTSYLAGVVTTLFNCGLSEGFILDYILNKETVAHNIEVTKLNKEMNIEVSKNAKVAQEKYEL